MPSQGQRGSHTPTILIVDDHEIVRQGIRSLLESARPEWNIVGEAENGAEAVENVKSLQPDVVVLDISMPVMNGLEAAKAISKLGVRTRTLIFTMHESERIAIEVKAAGANGFVLKSQAARDLVAAIEALLGGGSFFGSGSKDGSARTDGAPPPGASNATGASPFSAASPF